MPISEKYSVNESQAVTYEIRFDPYGWINFSLNEITGDVFIHSDWGDFTYAFPGRAKDTPIAAFFANAQPDYLVNKFAMDKAREFRSQFDLPGTIGNMRKEICTLRREGYLEKENARSLWEELGRLQHEASNYTDPAIHEYYLWTEMGSEASRCLGEIHELFCYRPSAKYEFCKRKLIPFLQQFLRQHCV